MVDLKIDQNKRIKNNSSLYADLSTDEDHRFIDPYFSSATSEDSGEDNSRMYEFFDYAPNPKVWTIPESNLRAYQIKRRIKKSYLRFKREMLESLN